MNPFSRTLGALRADRGRASVLTGVAGVVLLAAWLVWMFVGQVAVYRTSARARVEVSPAPTAVAAPVAGPIVEVHLEVGARVAAGDVLVALDRTAPQIALDRATAALAALEPELASVDRELAAEAEAGRGGAAADREAQREVLARQREVEAALAHAEEEEARTAALIDDGAVPAAERSRVVMEVKRQRAALDALVHAASGRDADRRERAAGRDVRREQLERQRAELASSVASARAELDALAHALELHVVRAPVAGVLGEVASLRPGGVLPAGAVVATVVPDGVLQIVAEYRPDAIGRLAPGQPARLRLDGFPWTHYGTVAATVARVGSELRDGVIRVELTLAPGGAALPVAHGMTGVVEIEVEHASPAELLVRAIGEDR